MKSYKENFRLKIITLMFFIMYSCYIYKNSTEIESYYYLFDQRVISDFVLCIVIIPMMLLCSFQITCKNSRLMTFLRYGKAEVFYQKVFINLIHNAFIISFLYITPEYICFLALSKKIATVDIMYYGLKLLVTTSCFAVIALLIQAAYMRIRNYVIIFMILSAIIYVPYFFGIVMRQNDVFNMIDLLQLKPIFIDSEISTIKYVALGLDIVVATIVTYIGCIRFAKRTDVLWR